MRSIIVTGTTTRGACASATLAIDKAAPAAAIALRRFTNEARRIVDASRALVLRDLRIWTERPRPIRDATAHVRRDDLGWRLSVLHPLLQCPERVETARTFTTAAMRHARRHEQPDGIGHLRRAAQRGQDAVVVVDGVSGRDERIVPAVVQKELAAPAEKLFQVWIGGVEQPVVQFVCEIDIVVEVERPEVPVRILEHDVLEMIRDDRKGIGPARHGAPPELAARL